MGPALLDLCKEGIQKSLASLHQHDRFNLIAFRETPAACFPGWSAAGPLEQAKATWFIEQLKSHGRTDLYASLSEILTVKTEDSRPRIVLFVSDGLPTLGLTDDYQILQKFSDENGGKASVFAFGAGPRVNRFFLDFLSRRNRGDTHLAAEPVKAPKALFDFNLEISRPILFDLSTHFLGLDESDIFPKKLTPLFLDRPLTLIGRIPSDSPPAALRIAGRDQTGPRDMVYRLIWTKPDKEVGPELAQEWAQMKLADLVSRHIQNPAASLPRSIQELCEEFNLPIPYADRLGFAPAVMLPSDE
jgi:Ca-activated chloride channel family protein